MTTNCGRYVVEKAIAKDPGRVLACGAPAGCSKTRAETGVVSGVIRATVATWQKPDVSTR